MTRAYASRRTMDGKTTTVRQDILDLENLIDQKMRLLSRVRTTEDRELIQVQIADLQTRRRELSVFLREEDRQGNARK